MIVHLLDGTYELFRNFFGAPSARGRDGREVGATRGLLRSLLALIQQRDVTHLAVAFDHVIESFRNALYPGYKRGDGIDDDLLNQFPLAEQAARALGIVTWPMVEFEADDALATAAARFGADSRVTQVRICSPDKDLAQCVEGSRIVVFDWRKQAELDQLGVERKYGVAPRSIADWLALVGDAADGIPGIPRWGAKSAALALSAYGAIDDIPPDAQTWKIKIRGAAKLADNLRNQLADARLYRRLATLRRDVPLAESLEQLHWKGAHRRTLNQLCTTIGDEAFLDRVTAWRAPDDQSE